MPLCGTKGERNWETPEGIDFDLLRQELKRLQSFLEQDKDGDVFSLTAIQRKEVGLRVTKSDNQKQPIPVVVEGFLLYHHQDIADLCRHRFWIETGYNTALKRRLNRDLPTRQHQEESRKSFAEWFQSHIWRHYQLYSKQQLAQAECILDSEWTVGDQLERIQQQLI